MLGLKTNSFKTCLSCKYRITCGPIHDKGYPLLIHVSRWSVHLHIVQCIFNDRVLRDEILQFLAVCVLLDSLRDHAETVEMNLFVLSVIEIISAKNIRSHHRTNQSTLDETVPQVDMSNIKHAKHHAEYLFRYHD